MSKDPFQKKLLETFKIEADEHFRSIAAGLLKLEKNPQTDEYVRIAELLHREAHSLKGAARAVDLLEIELIIQPVEQIFAAWKRNELKATQQQFDVLHQTINMLQQAFANKDIMTIDKKIVSETVYRLNHFLQVEAPAVSAKKKSKSKDESKAAPTDYMTRIQTVRIAASKLDSLLLKSEEMLTVKLVLQKYLNEFSRINESIRTLKTEWHKMLKGNGTQCFDRIKLLEKSVIELRSQFEADGRQSNALIDGLLDIAKDLVMLPFATLLDSFPMMVRNLSREQAKDINFILEGTEVEIDKRILDELKDPLIHIIRNSIDHGIEKSADRKSKPSQGTIKVAVSQFSGTEIEIIISDDGIGIDVNAVKKSAIKQGLLSQHEAQTIDDQEALSLIYQSGVSTSPIITNVSGHGLGMAIVHEKIEKIGGHIELKSQINVGTEIKLSLPLALTTYKGVLIKSAGQTFVLPTAHLERMIRIRPEDIRTVENKETIILDSKTLSLVRLNEILGLPNQPEKKSDQNYHTVAIIHFGKTRAAFQLDEVYGEQEVLVKKLNKPLVRVKYIAAATILETGVPVPILSTSDLIKTVLKDSLPPVNRLVSVDEETSVNKTILIVEDSITTRMLLKNILEMVGYTVITAVDGADAWRILRENEIALVVSDVEMPRMNGFELTKNIRNDKELADLPVVLVSTRESQEDREYGIDAGANAYLVKSSFDDSNLVAVIKRLL